MSLIPKDILKHGQDINESVKQTFVNHTDDDLFWSSWQVYKSSICDKCIWALCV